MNEALSELLTNRFYEWEARGRGWRAFPYSVDLEPEFYPFFGHYPAEQEIIDDSRVPTVFSRIGSLFTRSKKKHTDGFDPSIVPPVSALLYESDEKLVAYAITLPKNSRWELRDMQQILLMLSYTENPVSFELVASNTAITTQCVCRESEAEHVFHQIRAYCPEAIVTKSLTGIDLLADSEETCVLDFGLAEEYMRPLSMADHGAQDPYVGLFAALEHLRTNERVVIQVLFKGAANPWSESIMRSVMDGEGGAFFADAPEMVKYAQEKVSAPLYAVCIKIAGQAANSKRAVEIAKGVSAALIRLTTSKTNKLQPLSYKDYPLEDMIADLYLRESHRIGMLFNAGELAMLAHFPTTEITSSKVERDSRTTRAAPESTRGHTFVLGMNTHQGAQHIVSVPDSLRLRHTHVIGATGTGKSTLLLSMIAQDIANGNGLGVLDPHGDLIETILAYVPKERIKDVVLIDPADGDYPVAFNILSAHSEIEKDILSSDLVAAFRRLSTSWGDQMNSVLANAILAFLESTDDGTLADLRRFLIEKPFREKYLQTIQDPHVVYYWQHEYPLLKSNSIGSILTRLDTFLRPKLIRNMVAQKKGLDFEQILDGKKILLVKLSQGLIGAENSFLLGTFFVSKIYQAAMARQAKSKDERNDFFLYIDEFQHFVCPSMSHILSGARKYHLGLILAHQDMQQLQKYDTELASSVVVNAGTRICFRLGDTDARRFAGGFSHFEAEDLENLKIGEAIVRIEQPNLDFSLSTLPLKEVNAAEAQVRMQEVIAASRTQYGTPRAEVETMLEARVPQHVEEKKAAPLPEPSAAQIIDVPQPMSFVPVEIVPQPVPAKKPETQHKYLQKLIKRMAESRGYKATIEALTPDGQGRVDVSLERGTVKIACEVSVTTSDIWEEHNVEKCLAAGYATVIVCSDDPKHLERIRTQVSQKVSAALLKQVQVMEPHDLFLYLDVQVAEDAKTEKVIKGYRVKIEYESPKN